MAKELRICPGVGARKCGAFLARLDRDPHPTCTRCRGKVCTRDMTCDFCAVWSAEQWELFAKKRSYKERKHRPSGSCDFCAVWSAEQWELFAKKRSYKERKHRPSGSAPPAQQTSPRAETSSGVSRPGTSSSSSSRPLGGQKKQGGGLEVHLVLCLVGLPLLPLDLGPARRVGVPLGLRLAWAGLLPLLLLLREEEEWELPAHGRRPFPASPSLWTLPNSHHTFHDVKIRGSLQSLAPALYPPAIHALWGVDRGRIRGLGHVRLALVDVAVALALALAPLPVRGQEVVSVGGGHRPRHALLVVAHAVSGRSLLTAIALGVEALGDRSRSSDGYRSLRDRSRREWSRSPAHRGERRNRTLSRIARVTARGQAGDYLLLLPACELRKQDDWPDGEPRRVWRRLPLSLLWLLESRRMLLLLREGHP